MEESDTHHDSDEAAGSASQSYISSNFQLGSWDDKNSIAFSAPQSKRIKCNNGDTVASLSNIDSQVRYWLPQNQQRCGMPENDNFDLASL